MTAIIIQIIGWSGAILLLVSFSLNLRKKLATDSLQYILMNLVGASLLVVNAYIIESYPFLVINLFWVIVSAIQLVKHKRPIVEGN